jgi:hypothetical protein
MRACALVWLLAACGRYDAALGHNLRGVRVALRDGDRTIIVGRLHDGVPLGAAGWLPFEGRWLPFAAELDARGAVAWQRTFPESYAVPDVVRDNTHCRWRIVREGNHETLEALDRRRVWVPPRRQRRGED